MVCVAELPVEDAAVQEAIQNIEIIRRDCSQARKKPMSNVQLQQELLKRAGKDKSPANFEHNFLGWPKCPLMQQGNPKHRAEG